MYYIVPNPTPRLLTIRTFVIGVQIPLPRGRTIGARCAFPFTNICSCSWTHDLVRLFGTGGSAGSAMAGHELACSETEAERVDQRQVERVIPRPSGRMGTRLTSIANRFQKMEKIGEGTYGVVYKARDMKKAGKLVALKKMWLDNREEGVQVTTLREVALLKDLNHENIIKMQEFICISPDIILVFDFVDQDLKQCLDKNFKSGLPSLLVKSCMLQILRGALKILDSGPVAPLLPSLLHFAPTALGSFLSRRCTACDLRPGALPSVPDHAQRPEASKCAYQRGRGSEDC
eukprot:6205700-Pleurochrysis_carterae.AAC.1